MPVNRKPPTAPEVQKLQEALTQLWAGAFARDKRMRDLVNMKNRVELLPVTAELNIVPVELHSGRAGSLIEHAKSFVGTLPSINVEPHSKHGAPSSDARRDAEQAERGFRSLFHQQLIANDFWHRLGGNLLMLGRGVLTGLPLPSVWTAQAGYPIRKKGQRAQAWLDEINDWKHKTGKLPFVINMIPADAILLKLDANDGVLVALETKHVNAEVVAGELGSGEVRELLSQGRLKWHDQLAVIQYVDDTYVAYFLTSTSPVGEGAAASPRASKRLKVWEHGLGKCPVVFIPGMRTDEKDYELRFKPFLFDAEEDLELYDFLLSRLATMVKAYYFPSYEWQLGLESDKFVDDDRPVEEVHIGGTTVTYKDENLRPMQLPGNLPDAVMLNTELDSLIQRNTLEDVLFGRVQGSTPAFAIRLRINVAKNKLVPHVTHLARGLTEVYDLVVRYIMQLDEVVVIDGEEITVEMAKNAQGRIGVSIDPKLPGEEGAELGKAKLARDLGLPEDWVWERILGIADPATVRLMRDVQELEELPEVKERLIRDALEELQIMVEEDETVAVLSALTQYGDRLDPEIIEALQGLLGQQAQEGEGASEAPPPPPPKGPGRGPWPGGGSPQATGGGRGLLTQNAPRPDESEMEPAAAGTEEEL